CARLGRFFSERLTQPMHKRGRLDAQEPVVERVPQVRLREASGHDEWDSLRLKSGDRLLARRTSAEVEASDNDVPRASARDELRVVVLHHDLRHFLAGEFLVGVILAVYTV